MPTRDDLIADWRKNLAEAADSKLETSPHAAWLTRLRLRLYQFLLSLYGDGSWQSADAPSNNDRQQNIASETDEPLAWQGKPAKDISAIRAVLSSVAEARPAPNVPGSFAEGIGAEAWKIVATLSGGIHPHRCVSLLQAKQVPARLLNRRDDITVEVRAKDEAHAAQIIQSNINWLRRFNRFVVPTRPLLGVRVATTAYRFTKWLDRWSFTLVTVFHFSLIVPLAYLWAAFMSSAKSGRGEFVIPSDELFYDYYWLAIRSLLLLAVVLTWLRLHWHAREQATIPFRRQPTP